MTDPSTIQATLLAGEALLASESATILSNYPACLPLPYKTELFKLNVVTWALRKQVDNAIYNGTTEELYTLLAEYLGNYSPATTTVLTFTSQPTNMNVGDADQTLYTTSNSSATVTYTTSNPNVATIVNGKLHAVGGGTCTVTASQAAISGYTSASVTSQSITVTAIITTVINFTQPNPMQVGDADQTLVATSNSPAAITFQSSDTTIATIVNGNQLHAVAPGSVTITASQVAQSPYTSGSAQKSETIQATVSFGYSDTDPSANITAVPLPNTAGFTLGASSLAITWPTSYDQKFIVFKVPSTQIAFITWYNSVLNNGQIPDQLYNTPVTTGGYTYYFTRQIATIDPTNPVFTYSA
jgi:hypothetical protein